MRSNPIGTLYAVFTSDQVAGSPSGVAVNNADGELYAPSSGPEGFHIAVVPIPVSGKPLISEEQATDVQPTTATLHGLVNPKGFDTHYRFEYVDQRSFETEGGYSSPNTEVTSPIDLGMIDQKDPVQAAISSLTPGTTYHWRIVAENSAGEALGDDQTFETRTPVSIRHFTTQTVGPELVELKADINPNGSAGSYAIRLGTTESYSTGESQGTCQ